MTSASPMDMIEVQRIAAAYPPEAKHTPRWEREAYLTDVQQLAWRIRFEPQAFQVDALAPPVGSASRSVRSIPVKR